MVQAEVKANESREALPHWPRFLLRQECRSSFPTAPPPGFSLRQVHARIPGPAQLVPARQPLSSLRYLLSKNLKIPSSRLCDPLRPLLGGSNYFPSASASRSMVTPCLPGRAGWPRPLRILPPEAVFPRHRAAGNRIAACSPKSTSSGTSAGALMLFHCPTCSPAPWP